MITNIASRSHQKKVGPPVSVNLISLLKDIPDLKIISQEIQDHKYCYNLQNFNSNPRLKPPKAFKVLKELIRLIPKLNNGLIFKLENYLFNKYGVPIDQTKRDALAQIQIVAQKINSLEV